MRLDSGSLKFTVHRKKTYTGSLQRFDSYSPLKYKRNTIKTLVNRAYKICSNDQLENELCYLRQLLKDNGYPKKIIN